MISVLVLLAIAGGQGGVHRLQDPDTLRVAEAVALARTANPALAAARLRADAASERIGPAGAWMDPQLTFGLMNRPIGGFGTDQPMTMNAMQLSQRFPWPGTLGFAKDRARHLAEAERLDAGEVEAGLVARVETVYYQIAFIDRAIAVMQRTRQLLRDFFQVSQARYAVGEGLQQDVLQAQVAIAGMTENITVMEQNRIAMAARLNALLARDATMPVGPVELPPAAEPVPDVETLMARAAGARPAILAAGQRVQAAAAGYRAARRRLYPDVMVTLGYGQRPQFDDFLTLMVGFSIPLWAGSRQLPQRREMQAMQAGAEAQARDLTNETFARLTELRADAERAGNLADLYATSILPQARAAVDAALSAYRVGRVEYNTLIQNELTVNRYEIEAVRLAAEYHQARARIRALLGAESGGER